MLEFKDQKEEEFKQKTKIRIRRQSLEYKVEIEKK